MVERVALITGGAKGIGRAIALALAEEGWSVAVGYRTSAAAGAETVAAIEARGGRGLALHGDVSDAGVCAELVERTMRAFGRIDALLNCAGPYHRRPIFEETLEGWHAMFDHNLHPVFYTTRVVAPIMRAQRFGRIVNFAMANADRLQAQPNVTAYSIAKTGILVLTRTFAKELAPDGITVNAISPGFLDSGSAPEGELEAMEGKIPAGYVGEVGDAVAAARFLLSDEARYVNGANLVVSGAWGI